MEKYLQGQEEETEEEKMTDDKTQMMQVEIDALRKVLQNMAKRMADLDSQNEGLSRMLEHKDEIVKIAERKVAALSDDLTFLADHTTRETWNGKGWRHHAGTAQELVGELREWVGRREQEKAAKPLIEHPESEGMPD